MFSVEYPSTHGLDGKVHKISIEQAYEIQNGNDKVILVYGEEGERIVTLLIKYLEEKGSYIFVPHTGKELEKLTFDCYDRVDITDKLIKQLDGRFITYNENKIYDIKDIVNSEQNQEVDVNTDEEDIGKAVYDFMSINYNHVTELLQKYVNENTIKEYSKSKNGKEALTFIKTLIDTISKISPIFFVEDDLIEIGILLNKINSKVINKLSNEEFQILINNGYDICERLGQRRQK